MAKRKLIWSQNAKIKLFEILDYFNVRNKSNNYSKKLYHKITKGLSILIKHPESGNKTDFGSIRGLIIENYILFYEYTDEFIIIHTIWDARQDPDNVASSIGKR